jgi:hypothetical protein
MPTVEELEAQLQGAQARITELNSESKGHRLNAATARTEADAVKAEALASIKTHSDAATAATVAATEATKAAAQRTLNADLRVAAKDAGANDVADVLALLPRDKIKLDGSGEIENAAELMTALKTAKPYLFGTPSTSSTTKVPDPNTAAVKLAKDMTPEERAAGLRALGVTARIG